MEEILIPDQPPVPAQKYKPIDPDFLTIEEKRNIIQCSICFDHYSKKDFFNLSHCKHSYCKNCVIDHIAANLNNGVAFYISCPGGTDCKSKF
jgi:hypothetical protein